MIAALVAAAAVAFALYAWWRRTPRTRVAERVVYAGSATFPAAAQDWPRWRGPRMDGISQERGLATEWPEKGPPQLWAAEVGLGFSSPVAAAGKVYLFTFNNGRDTLSAFDARTGKIVWNRDYGGGWTGPYTGTRASPTIDGDAIYTYGGQGDLVRWDLASGEVRWRVNVLAETGASNTQWGMASSPLVLDDLVYVQNGVGSCVAVAVDKETGKVAWKSKAQGPGGYAPIVPADVAGARQLIVLGGDAVWGMDAKTGETRWSEAWKTNYQVNATTPVVRDGHIFISSAYDHGCMMLRLSAAGAEKLWETKVVQSRFQGAVLDGDDLFANSEGKLVCLAWPDGKERWRAKDRKLDLGVGGSFVRVEDKLLLMSERGKLGWARATGEGAELLAQADVLDGTQIWSTPLIYGGRLYAKGTAELLCFDLTRR